MIALVLWSLACTPAPEPADTDDDGPQDTGDPVVTGHLEGTVRDVGGEAMAGVSVNMCLSVCTTVETDAAGAYAFDLPEGTYSFHLVPPPDQALAQPLVPLTITEGGDRSVDVVLPPLGPEVALPAETAEIEIAPGVLVTTRQGDLAVPLEEEPQTHVSGVRVDAAHWPPIPLAGTIAAVWYLAPYEAEADPPMPIKLSHPGGDHEGDYVLYRSDYWTYDFVEVGELVNHGEWLLDPDARLDQLTTLVLVEAEDVEDPEDPYTPPY